jgi:transketolase
MKDVKATVKMRRCFVDILHAKMAKNKNIWVVTGDLGYKMWDEIKSSYGDRFINVGAAEQAMLGVGIGLALEGKIPFVYSITPFLLYRPFESIRNYVNQEKIPVKLVSSGRGRDYVHDGFSHWAQEDREIMGVLKNIYSKWPATNEELPDIVDEMIKNNAPYYLNLRK